MFGDLGITLGFYEISEIVRSNFNFFSYFDFEKKSAFKTTVKLFMKS